MNYIWRFRTPYFERSRHAVHSTENTGEGSVKHKVHNGCGPTGAGLNTHTLGYCLEGSPSMYSGVRLCSSVSVPQENNPVGICTLYVPVSIESHRCTCICTFCILFRDSLCVCVLCSRGAYSPCTIGTEARRTPSGSHMTAPGPQMWFSLCNNSTLTA